MHHRVVDLVMGEGGDDDPFFREQLQKTLDSLHVRECQDNLHHVKSINEHSASFMIYQNPEKHHQVTKLVMKKLVDSLTKGARSGQGIRKEAQVSAEHSESPG